MLLVSRNLYKVPTGVAYYNLVMESVRGKKKKKDLQIFSHQPFIKEFE